MSSSAAATVVLLPAVDALMKKLKRNLVSKQGDLAFLRFAQALGVEDDVSPTTISINTAKDVIRQVADVTLTDGEVNTLLAWLDRNGERVITPSELLAALRSQQNALRRSTVARLWESFERHSAFDVRTSSIPVDAVLGQFDPSYHPLVIQGQVSASEIESQAAEFFSNAAALSASGKVTRGLGVESYFATIGTQIPLDKDFAAMVAACWNLPGFSIGAAVDLLQTEEDVQGGRSHNAPALQAGMTVDVKASVLLTMTMERALNEMLQHHRKSLQQQQNPRAAFRVLGSALRSADSSNGKGFLPRKTFVEVIEASSRLYVAYEPVLDLFDRNADGSVDYRHYLAALVGELAPSRKVLAERLWQQFPRDNNNCVAVAEIHRRFLDNSNKTRTANNNNTNTANKLASTSASSSLKNKQLKEQFQQLANATTAAGNSAQAAELALFLDSWDMRKQHGVVSSFELLCEWFVPLSATIEQDSYFVDYLKKQWGLTI